MDEVFLFPFNKRLREEGGILKKKVKCKVSTI